MVTKRPPKDQSQLNTDEKCWNIGQNKMSCDISVENLNNSITTTISQNQMSDDISVENLNNSIKKSRSKPNV